jgi:hypothetical protein
MIDWFASKIGMIIFILIIGSTLLYFTQMQNNIYTNAISVQEINNVARLIDNLCDGCSLEYNFFSERSISVSGNVISIGEFERKVISDLVPKSFTADKVIIKNVNGKILFKVL